MDRADLKTLLADRVLVPGPDGPCDAEAKARMRQDYHAYHERIIEYGRARRAAQVEARRFPVRGTIRPNDFRRSAVSGERLGRGQTRRERVKRCQSCGSLPGFSA